MFDDLEPRRLLSATLSNGILHIDGTNSPDVISVSMTSTQVLVTENGVQDTPVDLSQVTGLSVLGMKGNDQITLDSSVTLPATLQGGAGADAIQGGAGNDVIRGNGGADSLSGGAGSDTLDGGGGNDLLKGNKGDDSLIGGTGNDTLKGNDGNDIIGDASGIDSMLGGPGDDRFFAQDGFPDTVDGQAGNDTVVTDDRGIDDLLEVETEPSGG